MFILTEFSISLHPQLPSPQLSFIGDKFQCLIQLGCSSTMCQQMVTVLLHARTRDLSWEVLVLWVGESKKPLSSQLLVFSVLQVLDRCFHQEN